MRDLACSLALLSILLVGGCAESPAPVPDAPGADAPDVTDIVLAPDEPDAPDAPGVMDIVVAPDTPDGSDATDIVVAPDTPDVPDATDIVVAPDAPDVPDVPGVIDAPDVIDIAVAPDVIDVPDAPRDVADAGDASCVVPPRCTGGGFRTGPGSPLGNSSPYAVVGVADLNSDARLDLVVIQNTGSGLYWLPATAHGVWGAPVLLGGNLYPFVTSRVAVGDFNGDRHIDVASIGLFEAQFYAGSATGPVSATLPMGPTLRRYQVLASGDFDGDGSPDLAWLGRNTSDAPTLFVRLTGTTPRTLSATLAVLPDDLSAADVDGDGRAELIAIMASSSLALVSNVATAPSLATISTGTGAVYPLACEITAAPGREIVDVRTTGARILTRGAGGVFTAGPVIPNVRYSIAACADLDGDRRDEFISPDFGAALSFHLDVVSLGPDGAALGSRTLQIATQTATLIARDLDGDGRVDLVLPQNHSRSWATTLFNRGGGRFDTPDFVDPGAGFAGTGATAGAAGDLDGDGVPEIVVTLPVSSGTTDLRVYRRGPCGYVMSSRVPCTYDLRHMRLVDVDGDRDLDVVMGSLTEIVVARQEGGRLLAPVTTLHGTDMGNVFAGDFDGDGLVDVGGIEPTNFIMYRATAPGVFAATPTRSYVGPVVAAADFDGDGRAELLVTTSNMIILARLSGATWTFPWRYTAPTAGTFGLGAIGDVNGDRRLDAVGSFSSLGGVSTVSLLGRAGGGFDAPVMSAFSPATGMRPALGDVNADGRLDLVWFDALFSVGLGDGMGRFVFTNERLSLLAPASSLHVADFDGDGLADLFAPDPHGAGILISRCGP